MNVSVPFPFPSLSLIAIPMELPWDLRSHWESHPRGHVYSTPLALSTKPPWYGVASSLYYLSIDDFSSSVYQ